LNLNLSSKTLSYHRKFESFSLKIHYYFLTECAKAVATCGVDCGWGKSLYPYPYLTSSSDLQLRRPPSTPHPSPTRTLNDSHHCECSSLVKTVDWLCWRRRLAVSEARRTLASGRTVSAQRATAARRVVRCTRRTRGEGWAGWGLVQWGLVIPVWLETSRMSCTGSNWFESQDHWNYTRITQYNTIWKFMFAPH